MEIEKVLVELQPCPHDTVIFYETTELRKISMNKYFKYRDDAVRYVISLLKRSGLDLQLTITITPAKSGGYSVLTATTGSSEDTGMEHS